MLLAVVAPCVGGSAVPATEARRLPGPPEVVSVQARPPERIFLSVSVLDERGEPVTGLTADDFVVREDGVRRDLVDFAREADRVDRPLSAVFLVDRSGSMGRQLARWKEAVPALLSALRPMDEVKLSVFAGGLTVLHDFTSDPSALKLSIEELAIETGGTRLFLAVDETLRDLRHRPGRKVVFLLTDGLDEAYAAAWNVTDDRYLSELLRKAVADEVTVITILPGPSSRPFLAAQDLAIQTGGWWLYPSDDLPGLVQKLGRRLMESYHLAFDSDRPLDERRRRRIEVTLARPEASRHEVRTVSGVFGQMPLLQLLEEDLADEDENLRVQAATGLAAVAHPGASRALKRALKDVSPKVRSAAATAIGRRGDASLAGRVAKLLEDGDPAVRAAALASLQDLLRSARTEEARARVLDELESAEEGP
ncbi:MAG: VWA domain-containing protein [Candidatus Polarisedimenticolia bacterium]